MALSKHALTFTPAMNARLVDVSDDFIVDNRLTVLEVVRQGIFRRTMIAVPESGVKGRLYVKHFSQFKKSPRKQRKCQQVSAAEERFKYEVAAMSSLSHPCLLTDHVTCKSPSGWFLCTLKPLQRSLSKVIELDLLDDVDHKLTDQIFMQVTCALLYMHHKGMVHLKVNPHNVFVDEFHNAVLANFETTQAVVKPQVHESSKAQEADQGMKVYPPESRGCRLSAFTAPEYLDTEVDAYKLDMHALGVLLYCMLQTVHYFTPRLFFDDLLEGGVRYLPTRYSDLLLDLTCPWPENRCSGRKLREDIREWPRLETLFQKFINMEESVLCLRD